MKYLIAEIEKALATVKQNGGPVEIDITFDFRERLLISYTDPFGEDQVTITLFKTDASMMPKITRTTRL